jgi:hypothetical protein
MSHHEAEIGIHSADEGFDRDEVKAGRIGIFAAAMIVVLLAILVWAQAYYEHSREQELYEKVYAPVGEDLLNLHAKEDSQLHSYGYINKDKGQVRLPIERAMDLMQKEYADGGKVYYSTQPGPVKPPEPAGVAPAPGTPAMPGAPAPGTQGAPAPSKPNAVGKAN